MTQANHAIFGRPLGAPVPRGYEEIVLGMGCYWGVERLFWQQDGVWLTEVGFAGGSTPNPTYRQVCGGGTGQDDGGAGPAVTVPPVPVPVSPPLHSARRSPITRRRTSRRGSATRSSSRRRPAAAAAA